MVIVEFKKEKHEENVMLAHQLKNIVCQLVDNMTYGAMNEKSYDDHYMLEERRGGGRMSRREDMEMGNKGGYRGGASGYHYPMTHYPYGMYPHHESFDNRYNY